MDLRFEAAAASELRENTINDKGIQSSKKFIGTIHQKEVLTLDRIDAISIRDTEKLKGQNIDLKNLSENLIQLFLNNL